jgi:8-oxo-dGTP pyrophosphatase MutT (NUDIX family)
MVDKNKLRNFFSQFEQNKLPGFEAHIELTPYRKQVQPTSTKENTKNGAVSVIISYHSGAPSIVLTKRANYQGVHGGQVSFPGGKHEEQDLDLQFTAQRETREETGILLEPRHFLTKLSEIYIPPSNFLVHPFLYVIENKVLAIENNEVDYLIEIPVSHLANNESLTQTDIKLYNGTTLKNAPCFIYNNEIIWGATAAILNELKWLLKSI